LSLIKLGEEIEIDTQAYELRRGARAVKLERIPMEILLFLLEHRAELVTREQIVEKVWGRGVFLDTDNSINAAIHKIRQALKDDPENPRFIRTITGKGYRFIATPLNGEPGRSDKEGPSSMRARHVSAGIAETVPAEADRVAFLTLASGAAEVPANQETARTSGNSATASIDVPSPGAAMPAGMDSATPAAVGPAAIPLPVTSDALAKPVWWIALAAVVIVGLAAVLFWRSTSTSASSDRPMLAVLPFENLTGDPGQDYFSDGFTEEMITRLGTLAPRRLGVIARTSVMYYKQSRAPLDRLARELGVQYVLEGSIRRDGQRVRVTAQLIQVKDQTHLWAQHYDRKQTDVLQVQEEITQAISDQIDLALGPFHPARPKPHALSEKSYEAYEHYLRGRYFWNKRTKEDFQRAGKSFQRAIDLDPEDARAYAGLADTYALMWTWVYAPAAETVPKARAAGLKALELDPNLAAALPALALLNETFDLDWSTAEARFKKAIELDPNYATAHHWYSELLIYQGRFDEALRESEIAGKLDPRSLIIAVDRAYLYGYARQYDQSIEQFRSVMAVDPNFPRTLGIVGSYAAASRYDEAMEEVQRRLKINDQDPYVWHAMATIYANLGQSGKAREALEKAEQAARRLNMDPAGFHINIDLVLGMKEEVMDSLQETCRRNPRSLLAIKVEPSLDPLRSDPRFADLVRCAHLQP
jgi:TolB-like protein/DNA-binding winged helix-turn-helix (wHTH) protein/Tfp pilus assembly protein PilF